MKPESIEKQIDIFVKEKYNKIMEEIDSMTINKKMMLVEMKSMAKWEEFKFGLRRAGYII